jgi:hypothetical protein
MFYNAVAGVSKIVRINPTRSDGRSNRRTASSWRKNEIKFEMRLSVGSDSSDPSVDNVVGLQTSLNVPAQVPSGS